MKKSSGQSAALAYTTIGIQLALTILLFLYLGYRLDEYYQKSPLFLIVFVFVGFCAGFYNLIRGVNSNEKRIKEAKDDDSGTKWL